MMIGRLIVLAGLALGTPLAGPVGAADHPLDPLDAAEIEAAMALLEAAYPSRGDARYPLVDLQEPPKTKVLAWSSGQPMSRAANLTRREGGKTFTGIVDLTAERIVEWQESTDAGFGLLAEEIEALTGIVTADERMVEALARRDLDDPEAVHCRPLLVGGAEGRRVQARCWDTTDLINVYSHPLGGLDILVDLDAKEVVGFTDRGVLPVATADHTYDAATMATRRRLKPFTDERPAGVNFTLDGHLVRWQGFIFHVRLDPRRGLVVSEVRYWDRGKRRDVLYQGSLAEIFVPYRLAAGGSWLGWTASDWGLAPSSLAPGLDVPATASFLGAVVANGHGRPYEIPRAIAVFERLTGDPAWRHHEAGGEVESRPAVELVVRSVVTLGTYDYVLDWIFTQPGGIRVEVGLTGLMLNEGVTTVRLTETTGAKDTVTGHLLAGNIVAPHHGHWLSFRIDLDVDGTLNTFLREDLVRADPESTGLGIFRLDSRPLRRESEAKLRRDPARTALWRQIQPGDRTDIGQFPGFVLAPGTAPLAADLRPPGFASHDLVVRRHADGELHPDDWSASDRTLEGQDLVLWYTLGFHHIPRLEDFPIVPMRFRGFELRPFHFFERNPSIDLRTTFAPVR